MNGPVRKKRHKTRPSPTLLVSFFFFLKQSCLSMSLVHLRLAKEIPRKILSACERASREDCASMRRASSNSTFENTMPSVRGVISRKLFSSPVHVRLRLRWSAQTPNSRSQLPQVLAHANAVHFGRGVKGCEQNDPGLPITNNFNSKFGNPCEVQ